MTAKRDPAHAVLASLASNDGPVSAQQIRDQSRLPLPLVTRILHSYANELTPSVERIEADGQVYYRCTRPISTRSAKSRKGKPLAEGRKKTSIAPASKPQAAPEPAKAQERAGAEHLRERQAPLKKSPTLPPDRPKKRVATPKKSTSRGALYSSQEPIAFDDPKRQLVLAIADKLRVPMNISRLSRATGIHAKALLPALKLLEDEGGIERKEVLDDIVYRPKPELGERAGAIALDSPEPPEDSPAERVDDVSQNTPSGIDSKAVLETVELLLKSLEKKAVSLQAAESRAREVASEIEAMQRAIGEWGAITQSLYDQVSQP